ncbi:SurA N-terminal domain-containing protein [Streptomyces millisiae]|uniref:SurA N-terminal domain-containing protein n=1 Tax=Streptomyces millisiae TaxID=3075542 RepID=A0ABU2LPY2_9ACTN|nr:SurA N-terminal domain-containing protein [Streptomyces sp. DSM 44918]MDT0319654.1 SurA N-terminal domain-containing protein [Streptomyces sp. DSM 44918]
MKRRRTSALSVSAAVALLAATPLLTGCSTDAHPGDAAVVGDQSISLATVQARVDAVRDAQRDQPNADELIATTAALTQQTVNSLVYMQLLEQAAADAGVEVTRRDVQEERANVVANLGGEEQLRQAALMPQGGVPLAGDEQIDETIRSQLLFQGLAQRIGADMDPNGQQLLIDELTRTAERVGVDVNPRYGEWDARQVMLVAADEPWLRAGEQAELPVVDPA